MDLYSENHELKDAKLPDVVRMCMNGDIGYEYARKWCREHGFSEHTFDRWLYLALREYPKAESLESPEPSISEQDMVHRILEYLKNILGWFQTRMED